MKLIPTIIQEQNSREVLMLGYMNTESLRRTKDTGFVWFWSRSRKRLWKKGEQSKNTLLVRSITIDCDRDTILIQVIPSGPTCHTGNKSCFFTEIRREP